MNYDPVDRVVIRECWYFLDFLGLVGGIEAAIVVVFALFVNPITDHMFMITAISSLYIVK